jgi:hypothetical protein
MFNDDELLRPQQFQRVGDFFEKREEYRKEALKNLRIREGLPTSERLAGAFYQREDGFYRTPPGKEVFLDTTMYPNGNDGFSEWAMGTRKGPSLDEATRNWASGHSAFEILETSEDGKSLQDELNDLDRDAHGMEIAQQVSHGMKSEQAPEFNLAGTSDEEVDARLQEYLRRGLR